MEGEPLRLVSDSLDASLAERLAQGDEAALGRLFDLYGSIAYGVALRILGDHGQAEDVVQDAFLRIWHAARRFDARRGTLRAWLLTTVRNRAVDRLRGREGKDRHALELPETLPANSPDSDPWRAASAGAVRALIEEAMGGLPVEQRQVVELAFWGGYSQSEIAQMIRVPLGTVKGRVRLALEKLSSHLEARGLEHD